MAFDYFAEHSSVRKCGMSSEAISSEQIEVLTPISRPRSGHAWCRGGNAGGIYLFGGEFSSPKQGTFYHYNDVSGFEAFIKA
jgi:hypothetical protein